MLSVCRTVSSLLAVGVLLCTISSCGCAGSSEALEADPGRASAGGTLRMIQEAPRSLDPLACNSVYEALPVNQIFDTLVAYDPSLNLIPSLAETWTISKDNREFTFVLREGVRFHDGSPLTAEDVVFSICRQLCPDVDEESLAQSYLMVIEGAVDFAEGRAEKVSGIQVIDSRTLEIRLATPYPSFLEVLAMDNLAIVPEALVREVGSETFGRSPIGTGPFRLAEWSDDLLRLEANEEYFRGKPHLDQVQIGFLEESDSDFGTARFTQGDLDVLEPPTESLASLADDRSVDLHRYQQLSLSFLGLNTRRPPLNQKWLRQAIAHALDRGAMVADSPTVRREAVGVLPPGIAGYSPDPKSLRYDPEESRRLLAENGHPNGDGLSPVVLHNASRGSSVVRLMAQMREDLEAVGIRLEVVPVTWTELGDHLDNQTAGAFLLAWIADLTDPDSFMRSLFESGGSGNYFGHLSDETDRLLAKGTQEFNPVERARIYREIERQVLEEAPMVPLYHTMGIVAVRKDVMGLTPTPLGLAKVDLESVWFQSPGARFVIGRLFKRRRLEQSFVVGSTVLVVLMIGATTALVHDRVSSALKRGLHDRGLAIANSIGAVATPSLLAYNYAALQIAAEGAVEDPALLYVVIHDKEGEIAGVAGATLYSSYFPSLPDEIHEAMSRPVTLVKDNDETKLVLEAVVPVRVEGAGEPWGTVRVGLSYASVYSELRRLEVWLAVSGVLLILLAMVSSRLMARRITAPLRRLAEGTVALSMGDTSYRIPVSGARELAELGQAFNTMMDRVQEKAIELEAYQNQLAQLNATLEEQVSQRTRALEESEAQYRTLVQHSPDSILIVQNGRVRFSNRAFEETFGITQENALDREFSLEDIFEDPYGDLVAERIKAWEYGDSPSSAEVKARDVHGTSRELELRGSRIEYRGRPAAECLLVDMTETKQLRERLADTERLSALGELASGVAHDFNNLLGAILGRIQLLRARDFDADVDQEMAVVEKAAMDGRETVRRIQEFSRVRTDRPVSTVNLSEIIRDAVEITRTRWKNEAERRNIAIQVHLDCREVPPVLGNAHELREVYTNLILNAVDAMPNGGDLTLRCSSDGDVVHSEVVDTGVGMPEEIRRHLFDPFFTTKGQGGTGLGMSVAYGIVTRHDGTIEVDSRLGQGTKFTLGFPVCESRLEVMGGDGASLPHLVRPGRILVIDDETSIAQLLEDALTGVGHTVEIAISGREGVELATLSEFDLVMTDLGMPDMSGWEVAATIRRVRPSVPIVLVTGWATTLSEDEVERCGINAVVHKPFEIQELLDTASRVLGTGPLSPGSQN